jgi:hypothetical protein
MELVEDLFIILLSFFSFLLSVLSIHCMCQAMRTSPKQNSKPSLRVESKTRDTCRHTWKRKDFRLVKLIYKSPVGKDVWRANLINSFQLVNIQLVPGKDCVIVHDWTVNLVSSRLCKPGDSLLMV